MISEASKVSCLEMLSWHVLLKMHLEFVFAGSKLVECIICHRSTHLTASHVFLAAFCCCCRVQVGNSSCCRGRVTLQKLSAVWLNVCFSLLMCNWQFPRMGCPVVPHGVSVLGDGLDVAEGLYNFGKACVRLLQTMWGSHCQASASSPVM
jgi:hypothetical protein